MSDNNINDSYASLIDSIGELYNVNESVKKYIVILSSFSNYLKQNEAEITKFKKATGELCNFMKNFDFSDRQKIETMHKKAEALHPLRLKLASMGEEAKKLAVFPDRYGSKKAVDVCRDLALACMERIGLDETIKVSDLVEANTAKLIELQQKFAGDGYILDQIKDVVDANKNMLNKYKAYFVELQQYINGFPHAGEDDLAVVEKRVDVLRQMDASVENLGKTIDEINTFCDRYNKNNVVMRYNSIVSEIYSKMTFVNADKYKASLNDILTKAQTVIGSFEKERNELLQMQSYLEDEDSDIWKEDNNRLSNKIGSLLKSDTRKTSFSLNSLKSEIDNAKTSRYDHIKATTEKYGWLTRDRYSGRHNTLVSEYMYSSEYDSCIEEMRKEHNKRIWKGIGIGVGIPAGIALVIATFGIIILVVGGYFIVKFVFSSRD